MKEPSSEAMGVSWIEQIKQGMKRRFGFRQPENLAVQPVPLRNLLIEAGNSPRHTIEKKPAAIDLGVFGEEAEKCMQLTIHDPQKAEYASICYMDKTGRVCLLTNPVRGEESMVQVPNPNGKRLLLIHSHPADTPLSPGDLEALFIPPTEIQSMPAELLATPTVKMLIFRTKNTPFLTPAQIMDISAEMMTDYGEEEEGELYHQRYQADGGEDNDRMPPLRDEHRQKMAQLSHKRMFVVSRAAKDYHLMVYTCPISENVAYPAN